MTETSEGALKCSESEAGFDNQGMPGVGPPDAIHNLLRKKTRKYEMPLVCRKLKIQFKDYKKKLSQLKEWYQKGEAFNDHGNRHVRLQDKVGFLVKMRLLQYYIDRLQDIAYLKSIEEKHLNHYLKKDKNPESNMLGLRR